MGVYEGVRVLSTTGHMVLLRLGQSPRGRGSLLPWGQTGLLQGSGDSGVGGEGDWSSPPHMPVEPNAIPLFWGWTPGTGESIPGNVRKLSPELIVRNELRGLCGGGRGRLSTCAAKHLGRRGAPAPHRGPRGAGFRPGGQPLALQGIQQEGHGRQLDFFAAGGRIRVGSTPSLGLRFLEDTTRVSGPFSSSDSWSHKE